MSLARAVTKRIKRSAEASTSSSSSSSSSPSPANDQGIKSPTMPIDRSKISLPVALVSTTNMLSYNAPDIATMRHVSSSTASTHSAEDSDHSVSTGRSRASSHGSRDTAMTDFSSPDPSPTSPKQNHLPGYFGPASKQIRKSVSTNSLDKVLEEAIEPVPALPQRALSHSKRAHEKLAQKRSLQTLNSRSSLGSVRHSSEQRTSVVDVAKTTIKEDQVHPFGRELEQLNEIAEEFGGVIRDAEVEADMSAMRSRNLATFCAADYLAEIRPLFSSRFGLAPHNPLMSWI